MQCFDDPKQPLAQCAAKVGLEPKVPDAALCTNGCYAQIADFAKFGGRPIKTSVNLVLEMVFSLLPKLLNKVSTNLVSIHCL